MVYAEYFDAGPNLHERDLHGKEPNKNALQNDDPQNYVGQIVMRPNNSMSWRTSQYFLATLITLSFITASAFALQGYWLILPFTALEMSILTFCFYLCIRRSQVQEVVSLSRNQVVLEIGRHTPEQRHEWQRFFTKVLILKPAYPWYPEKVALRCRHEEFEIGRFLTAADKACLIKELRQMIALANRSTNATANPNPSADT